MRFQGAIVRERGVTFAIAVVKPHVIRCKSTSNEAFYTFERAFPGVPVVLMAQDNSGRPSYLGRADITKFLAQVPVSAIPWREYTLT